MLVAAACDLPTEAPGCDPISRAAPIELEVALPDTVRVLGPLLTVRGEIRARGRVERVTLRLDDQPERGVTLYSSTEITTFTDSVTLPLRGEESTLTVTASTKRCSDSVSVVVQRIRYRPVFLGTLGGERSRANDVNEHGHVVGSSLDAGGETRAFLWRDGRMVALDTLPIPRVVSNYWPREVTNRAAHAINDRGEIVGSDVIHAVAWRDGQVRNLGVSAYTAPHGSVRIAVAHDVNEAGVIVGGWRVAEACIVCSSGAFLIEDGRPSTIHATTSRGTNVAFAINSDGDVVGQTAPYMQGEAFLFRAGTLRRLPGMTATDINDRGQVVGYSEYDIMKYEPPFSFLVEGDQVTRLPFPECIGSPCAHVPRGINRRGVVVGGTYLWEYGRILDIGGMTRAYGLYATAINDRGQIVGSALNPATGRQEAVLLEPVP